MFSWTMLISGDKLAEQIRSAIFGKTAAAQTIENDVRDDNKTASNTAEHLNS